MTKTLSIFAALLFIAAGASADIKPDGILTAQRGSVALPSRTKADAYLFALGQIESGENDFANGRHGEISRFQCLKSVWRKATAQPYASATNPAIAAAVVIAVIHARTGVQASELTPEAFARAWHCPAAKHLNREQRDYVNRFINLCHKLP